MGKKRVVAMALLALLVGCTPGAPLSPADSSGSPTGSSGIRMEPYTSQEYGLRGVAPAGWVEGEPSSFYRGTWPQDPTQLMEQAFPGMTLEWVTIQTVLPGLRRQALPASTGTRSSPGLTWQLYAMDLRLPEAGLVAVDLALAADDRGVYIIVLLTRPQEAQSLHEAVFLPAVEALEPFSPTSRDWVTAQSLLAAYYPDRGPANNIYFAPLGEAGPPLQVLEGTLAVPEFYMQSHYLPADAPTVGHGRHPYRTDARHAFPPGHSAYRLSRSNQPLG